jgi:hypothetical protein
LESRTIFIKIGFGLHEDDLVAIAQVKTALRSILKREDAPPFFRMMNASAAMSDYNNIVRRSTNARQSTLQI